MFNILCYSIVINIVDICSMFRAFLVGIVVLISSYVNAQTFQVSSNVLSTSLYQPFASVGGYTLAFERILDPGYSLNLAQFSYKLNLTLISDSKKGRIASIGNTIFYDEDAYQYSGFMVVPELKYYITWDAPMGIYFNVFGIYNEYLETYTDEKLESFEDFEKKYNSLGRGVGAGFQFNVYKKLTLDIVGGYHNTEITSKTKNFGDVDFVDDPKENDDGLYINAYLGFNF